MKKIILSVALAFFALSSISAYAYEYAQTALVIEANASTSAKMDRTLPIKPILKLQGEIRAKIDAREASSTEGNQDLRERNSSSTRENLGNVVRKIIRNRFEKMLARFKATIDRQESIAKRIISRIEKVKAEGGNTTVAEQFVAEAKIHLEEARVTLGLLETNAKITAELESDPTLRTASSTRASLVNLRKISQDLEHHLRETHKALIGAVSNLLGMSSARPKLQATTTTEVNTQI